MYSVKFDVFLPHSLKKLTAFAHAKSINDYNVIGLTLRFLDEDEKVVHIKYDREFFDEVENEANEALLEEYYYAPFGRQLM